MQIEAGRARTIDRRDATHGHHTIHHYGMRVFISGAYEAVGELASLKLQETRTREGIEKKVKCLRSLMYTNTFRHRRCKTFR
mmetsp:Transcript_29435/g.90225  ORF Transcript_29435/g.90225 Transcript_29435/m.90225 type:complete len:82 (-) Transcript_29435:1621-1866(-)